MRIIGGAWRGRVLQAPAGLATRPTAERVRQALFDRLLHAPWAGRDWLTGAAVLDGFAGTGALGLEALSRGAGHVTFLEHDRAALVALRANIAACGAQRQCTVVAGDARRPPPPAALPGELPAGPAALVLLDPPYHAGLVVPAAAGLLRQGWIGPATLVVIETALTETVPGAAVAEFTHGAARMHVRRGPDWLAAAE